MSPKDRDYFAHRAEQELNAAARSLGWVRSRHEELAWLYQMRVIYLDRGITGEEEDQAPALRAEPMLVQEMIIPA